MSEQQPADERVLTAAQADHIRRLYATFEQAQKELNDFTSYLFAEHGIDDPEQWQFSRDMARLVRAKGNAEPRA